MLATRIKRRPYSFALWVMLPLLFTAWLASFWKSCAYFGEQRCLAISHGAVVSIPIIANAGRGFAVDDVQSTSSAHGRIVDALGAFSPRVSGIDFVIPLGWPLIIFAGIVSFIFWRPLRALGPNECRTCGYDLRGIESGICPECGNAMR